MPKKKHERICFKEFESKVRQGRFIRISYDMTETKAWKELSLRQRGLYYEMKKEYMPEKCTKGIIIPANDKHFCFTYDRWSPLYKNNERAWFKDRQALIDRGFIERLERGYTTRTPDIYGFSDKWKEYGK